MANASAGTYLTVKDAALRLGMTPEGVRKAVREGRLAGETQSLPSGRREYILAAEAVEAFRCDREPSFDEDVDTLRIQLALADGALRDKDAEIDRLRHELGTASDDLARTRRALGLQIQAFNALLGVPSAESTAIGDMA